MQHNSFPKGSEWRKWDFHVHTPESILNTKFGNDWDHYVQVLFRTAIRENISSIGITDYYSIEGYKRLKKEYLESPTKLKQLFKKEEVVEIKKLYIFPNLEFRLKKLIISEKQDLKWNRKVNFHLLFSDKVKIENIEDNFLKQLHFEYKGATAGSPQKKPLTNSNLIDLGNTLKKQNSSFSKKDPLYLGILSASIDDNEIFKILSEQEDIFRGMFLFGFPFDEDLSKVSWTSQGAHERKILIQKSHFAFSSNPNTIEFCLGKKHPTIDAFKDEFGHTKPCFWGSDAHDFSSMFKPKKDRFCWIKANPTFEGLKQAVYEPEERVNIQQNEPESKTPYLVIDKVRYIDKTTKKTFMPHWIEFNQNFNAIIGGKSSGKSLLLYHIAQTIDQEQVKYKSSLVKGNDYKEFVYENPFDFEVMWKNSDKDKLSDPFEDIPKNQVTFVPQVYINQLAEEKGEEQLFKLIESILVQNKNYKIFIDKLNQEIQNIKIDIAQNIELLISLKEELSLLRETTKKIGDENNINKELIRINSLIEGYRKQSGFNKSENDTFELLSTKQKKNDERKSVYLHLYNIVSLISEVFTEQENEFITALKNEVDEIGIYPFEYRVIKGFSEKIISDLEISFSNAQKNIAKFKEKIEIKIKEIKINEKIIEKEILPFIKKIKNQEQIKKLKIEQNTQNEKIQDLKQKKEKIRVIIEKGKRERKSLLENYEQLLMHYRKNEIELSKPEYKEIGDDLELNSELTFDSREFLKFTDLFDLRSRLNTEFHSCFNDNNEFIYSRTDHVLKISSIFEKLKDLSKIKLRLRTHVTHKDLYSTLFRDCFIFKHSIHFKKENVLRMSPGKRGLVLLQLIIHISNAIHPILIDQPEDNLDNRTIYAELKKFLRTKKKIRQIIMVTHNANLVVSTDSENVIVANQSGQQIGKDKREFVFEYISGSLENSYYNRNQIGILYKYGIREHVCDILEGGVEAFIEREKKYGLSSI